jgi:hypothetical protein
LSQEIIQAVINKLTTDLLAPQRVFAKELDLIDEGKRGLLSTLCIRATLLSPR